MTILAFIAIFTFHEWSPDKTLSVDGRSRKKGGRKNGASSMQYILVHTVGIIFSLPSLDVFVFIANQKKIKESFSVQFVAITFWRACCVHLVFGWLVSWLAIEWTNQKRQSCILGKPDLIMGKESTTEIIKLGNCTFLSLSLSLDRCIFISSVVRVLGFAILYIAIHLLLLNFLSGGKWLIFCDHFFLHCYCWESGKERESSTSEKDSRNRCLD